LDEELKEFEDKTKGGFNAKTNLKSGLDHPMVSTETYAKVLDFVEEPSFNSLLSIPSGWTKKTAHPDDRLQGSPKRDNI